MRAGIQVTLYAYFVQYIGLTGERGFTPLGISVTPDHVRRNFERFGIKGVAFFKVKIKHVI